MRHVWAEVRRRGRRFACKQSVRAHRFARRAASTAGAISVDKSLHLSAVFHAAGNGTPCFSAFLALTLFSCCSSMPAPVICHSYTSVDFAVSSAVASTLPSAARLPRYEHESSCCVTVCPSRKASAAFSAERAPNCSALSAVNVLIKLNHAHQVCTCTCLQSCAACSDEDYHRVHEHLRRACTCNTSTDCPTTYTAERFDHHLSAIMPRTEHLLADRSLVKETWIALEDN